MISNLEIQIDRKPVPYPLALETMEKRAEGVIQGNAPLLWLLEHPPLYTLGTSASPKDVLDNTLPTFETGRGGQVTYHGPGQRVAYLVLDLKKRNPDLRTYIRDLEEWLISTLSEFEVTTFRREGRVGIWVEAQGQEKKIAAIGVRVRKWVTLHGVALNVNPDLSHYQGIVPCGLTQYGVTSLADLGISATLDEVDAVLIRHFQKVFG